MLRLHCIILTAKKNKVFINLFISVPFLMAFVTLPIVHAKEIPSSYDVEPIIIFSENFDEFGGLRNFGFAFSGNPSVEIISEPFISSSPALKVTLDRNTDKITYRTEVQPVKLPEPYFESGSHAKIGKEYWYEFKTYLPKNWEFDDYPEIIAQWHNPPDSDLGEEWRSPALSLIIGSGTTGAGKNYLIETRSDAKQLTPPKTTKHRYPYYKRYEVGKISLDLGRWVEWKFHIKWSFKTDGFIEIFKDGKKILNIYHQPNTFNDRLGPYLKFGIYKWVWDINNPSYVPPYNITTRTIYFDDLRIGSKKE